MASKLKNSITRKFSERFFKEKEKQPKDVKEEDKEKEKTNLDVPPPKIRGSNSSPNSNVPLSQLFNGSETPAPKPIVEIQVTEATDDATITSDASDVPNVRGSRSGPPVLTRKDSARKMLSKMSDTMRNRRKSTPVPLTAVDVSEEDDNKPKERAQSLHTTPTSSPNGTSRNRTGSGSSRSGLVKRNILQPTDNKITATKSEGYKFGLSLNQLLEEGREIPLIVLRITSYLQVNALDTPGIFFFETENSSDLQTLKGLMEKGKAEISEVKDNYLLAALLKLFFLELPEPLLTFERYDDFLCVTGVSEEWQQLNLLRSLVYGLPSHNRVLLQYLLSFLRTLNEHSSVNMMDFAKIAKVFGPILLRPRETRIETHGQLHKNCPTIIELLLTHYNRVFLVTDEPDLKFTLKDNYPIIRAGTVDAIIKSLLDPYMKDEDYWDIIIATHDYFMNSLELFTKLKELHNNLKNEESSLWKEKGIIRIVKFIKMWISHSAKELRNDQAFVSSLQEFIEGSTEGRLLQGSFELLSRTQERVDIVVPSAFEKRAFNILDLSISEMAQHIAVINHRLFVNIDINECLYKAFTKPEKSPTFTAITNKFNEWSQWVATEIVKREDIGQRAEVISCFIKLSEACKEVNDFYGSYAIIAGLNLSSISRLKLTWARVSKPTMVKYQKMMELFDMTKNYKNYRDELAKCENPIVPYIALFHKYLFSIEENNPDTINELVNFTKFRLLFQQMKELEAFQKGAYNFQKDNELDAFLTHSDVLDEERLFKLSLKCEPKEKEREKVFKNPMHGKSRTGTLHKKDQKQMDSFDNECGVAMATSSEIVNLTPSDSNENLSEDDFEDLNTILSRPKARKIFENWLEINGSSFFLEFIAEVDEYKTFDDPMEMKQKAVTLFDRFFTKKGEEDYSFINLDEDVLQQLRQKVQFNILSSDSFNLVQLNVLEMLERAYYPVFILSKTFEAAIQDIKRPQPRKLSEDRRGLREELIMNRLSRLSSEQLVGKEIQKEIQRDESKAEEATVESTSPESRKEIKKKKKSKGSKAPSTDRQSL